MIPTDSSSPVMVTVICLSFNHERYLRQCLEGFVKQKTLFPFEVYVHDDASTDGSQQIISEYAARYPDLIKPFFETENQYSRGQKVLCELWKNALLGARGKYVAFCEADDYWTSPGKLQFQVDFLEAHPEYGMCFHEADNFDEATQTTIPAKFRYPADTDVSAEELIMGSGNYCPTNSICLRKSLLDMAPEMIFYQYVGDYPLQMYFGLVSKVRYMARSFSAYRINTGASWSNKTYGTKDFMKYKPIIDKEMVIYRDFTAQYPQYAKTFERKKNKYLAYYYSIYGQYSEARKAWLRQPWKDRDKSFSMLMRLWGPKGLYDRIKRK